MKNKLSITLIVLSITFLSFTCNKDTAVSDSNSISDGLHLSFATPDWSKFINCELLNLNPYYVNDSTNMVSAISVSTKETFYFSIPADRKSTRLNSSH